MDQILYNPWHGCRKYSQGCLNCYVYRIDAKNNRNPEEIVKNNTFNLPIQKLRSGEYKIKDGQKIMTCLSSDFFLQEADVWRGDVWDMIKERATLHFSIITKRIARFEKCLPKDVDGENFALRFPNVEIICTVENEEQAQIRLPIFKSLNIAQKSIICEPILDEINLAPYLDNSIKNVIVGGESGAGARVCNFEWVEKIRACCMNNKVSFYFKQTGENFQKNNKIYKIPRKLMFSQAKKANINLKYYK